MVLKFPNPTKRLNLNANKLANVRRDIVNRERLTKMELQAIQLNVKRRDENTRPCETDADITPEERHTNKNRENNKQTESHMQEQLNIDATQSPKSKMRKVQKQQLKQQTRPSTR